MTVYIRICPGCKKDIKHKSLQSYRNSMKNKLLCRSCVMIGNKRSFGKNTEKKPKYDLIGQRFNNWKVASLSHREDGGMWYWNIECTNCGYRTKRFTNYVKESKSCCHCLLLPKGDSGLKRLIKVYCDSAKKRGLSFELSKEQFRLITSSPCYYCGCLPKSKKRGRCKDSNFSWGDYIYNGIDRIDNSKGLTTVANKSRKI